METLTSPRPASFAHASTSPLVHDHVHRQVEQAELLGESDLVGLGRDVDARTGEHRAAAIAPVMFRILMMFLLVNP